MLKQLDKLVYFFIFLCFFCKIVLTKQNPSPIIIMSIARKYIQVDKNIYKSFYKFYLQAYENIRKIGVSIYG